MNYSSGGEGIEFVLVTPLLGKDIWKGKHVDYQFAYPDKNKFYKITSWFFTFDAICEDIVNSSLDISLDEQFTIDFLKTYHDKYEFGTNSNVYENIRDYDTSLYRYVKDWSGLD